MVGIGALWAYFVLALFSGCPTWGNGINITTTGCPNLYKEQRTNVFFTIRWKCRRPRMGEVNAPPSELFNAGRGFDNPSMKTLVNLPHIIIGNGLLWSII